MPDWFQLLPEDLAKRQIADERARTYLRAIEAGASVADIARIECRHRGRIYQLLDDYRRHQRNRKGSPVERYLAESEDPRVLLLLADAFQAHRDGKSRIAQPKPQITQPILDPAQEWSRRFGSLNMPWEA